LLKETYLQWLSSETATEWMDPSEFISFGEEQRTFTQFSEVGWKRLESFEV
jgi:hypothetical protein